MKDQQENKKKPGQEENAGAKELNESELEEPSQEELKEAKTDELIEYDPDEQQEGVEMEDQAENGKIRGQAEDAGAKKLD